VRSHLGGLLPEVSTSPRSRLARGAGTSSADVLGLLAVAVGDVAAVRRHLERSREDEHLGDADSSLPGVQPKTALAFLDGRWHVPRASAASTHILKPERPDRPALLHDEALSSRAAEAAGLRSAVSKVVEFDGFPALVIPRFDRQIIDGVVHTAPTRRTAPPISDSPATRSRRSSSGTAGRRTCRPGREFSRTTVATAPNSCGG